MALKMSGRAPEKGEWRAGVANGYTLVELLVVIAVVAVLATAVTAFTGSALLKAKESRSSSNMRNIGVALHLYAGDHGGNFPETSHTVSLDEAWIASLEDYLGDYDETRICPADPQANERLEAGGTSYILNSFIFVPETDAWGDPIGTPLNSLTVIPEPENTIIAFVCSDSFGPGPGNDHTHSSRWSSWSAVEADISPSRFGGGGNRGRCNYLFVDGSVKSISAAKMKQKTQSGQNIAYPPGLE